MKKETIEEAAENYNDDFQIKGGSKAPHIKNQHIMNHFIAGAKYQSERMYSEEDMKTLIDIITWYDERMYSEEDMEKSFMACWKANVPDGIECKLSFKEWFEQFKKK